MITYHEEDGNIILKYETDAEPVLNHVKQRQEEYSPFYKTPDMRYAGSIPMDTLLKIGMETGLDFFNNEDCDKIIDIAKRDYPNLFIRRRRR